MVCSGAYGGPTRKERREQARAERKALEQHLDAQKERRKRLTILGTVAAVVVAGVIVLIVAIGSGSSPAPPLGHGYTATTSKVSTPLNGIPQSGNTLGNASAPITLEYFGDLECPFCQQFTLNVLPTLIQQFVRAGKLKITYLSLETATKDSGTFNDQQVAAYAAGAQQKAWNYIETFYNEQGAEGSGYVTEAFLQSIAGQIPGLNLAAWQKARQNPQYASQVQADLQAASNAGFTSTPSFLLGKSGQTLQPYQATSVTDPSGYISAIQALGG